MDSRETEKRELLAYQALRLRVEEALKELESRLDGINRVKNESESPSA